MTICKWTSLNIVKKENILVCFHQRLAAIIDLNEVAPEYKIKMRIIFKIISTPINCLKSIYFKFIGTWKSWTIIHEPLLHISHYQGHIGMNHKSNWWLRSKGRSKNSILQAKACLSFHFNQGHGEHYNNWSNITLIFGHAAWFSKPNFKIHNIVREVAFIIYNL